MNLNSQNHYTYIDNKTIPIVFIHGVGLDRKMWTPQINYFSNYSTLTYDLLGHGKTPFEKEKIKIQDYVEQLQSLTELLNIDKFGSLKGVFPCPNRSYVINELSLKNSICGFHIC